MDSSIALISANGNESAAQKILKNRSRQGKRLQYLRLSGDDGYTVGAAVEELRGDERAHVDGDSDALRRIPVVRRWSIGILHPAAPVTLERVAAIEGSQRQRHGTREIVYVGDLKMGRFGRDVGKSAPCRIQIKPGWAQRAETSFANSFYFIEIFSLSFILFYGWFLLFFSKHKISNL